MPRKWVKSGLLDILAGVIAICVVLGSAILTHWILTRRPLNSTFNRIAGQCQLCSFLDPTGALDYTTHFDLSPPRRTGGVPVAETYLSA